MPATTAAEYNTYRTVNVETASQSKIIIMLYNGAIQRAEQALIQLEKSDIQEVHNNLIRAQQIIAELRGSLNLQAGPLADNLNRVYEYFQHLLIKANVYKDAKPLTECIEMLTLMRDTWQELFDNLAKEEKPIGAPKPKHHSGSVINIQG